MQPVTQFLGNFATVLGGTFGILIGVVVIGVVMGILVLPLIFMSHHDLGPSDEETRRLSARRLLRR